MKMTIFGLILVSIFVIGCAASDQSPTDVCSYEGYCLFTGPTGDANTCEEGYTDFGAGLCGCSRSESWCAKV